MRTIPNPRNLRAAVAEVIRQNKAIGYNPPRFFQKTDVETESELISACDDLLLSDSAFAAIWVAVKGNYRELLTLEDLVVHSRHGKNWNLGESSINMAEYRVECLDQALGHQRWGPSKA